MSQSKRASKQKRARKAIPVLGAAAGLSLAVAGGVTSAIADAPTRPAIVAQEVTLAEEEISDVSLATFYVFDNEHAGKSRPGMRLAMAGGCGCSGCTGCGGCWTGTYYDRSVFSGGNDTKPVHRASGSGHKYAHAPKRTPAQKSP